MYTASSILEHSEIHPGRLGKVIVKTFSLSLPGLNCWKRTIGRLYEKENDHSEIGWS